METAQKIDHSEHVEGNKGGPFDCDCGCRGGPDQKECADAGCWFCIAANNKIFIVVEAMDCDHGVCVDVRGAYSTQEKAEGRILELEKDTSKYKYPVEWFIRDLTMDVDYV